MSTRSAGKRFAVVTAMVATGLALAFGSAGTAAAAAPQKSVVHVVSHQGSSHFKHIGHFKKHPRHHGRHHNKHNVRHHISRGHLHGHR